MIAYSVYVLDVLTSCRLEPTVQFHSELTRPILISNTCNGRYLCYTCVVKNNFEQGRGR